MPATTTTTLAPLSIARTARGALDVRKMGAALAARPETHETLDAIGADAADHDAGPDLGALADGPIGAMVAPVTEAAASEVHGARSAVAAACLTFAIGESRKSARRALRSAVKVAAGRALWAPVARTLPSGE